MSTQSQSILAQTGTVIKPLAHRMQFSVSAFTGTAKTQQVATGPTNYATQHSVCGGSMPKILHIIPEMWVGTQCKPDSGPQLSWCGLQLPGKEHQHAHEPARWFDRSNSQNAARLYCGLEHLQLLFLGAWTPHPLSMSDGRVPHRPQSQGTRVLMNDVAPPLCAVCSSSTSSSCSCSAGSALMPAASGTVAAQSASTPRPGRCCPARQPCQGQGAGPHPQRHQAPPA